MKNKQSNSPYVSFFVTFVDLVAKILLPTAIAYFGYQQSEATRTFSASLGRTDMQIKIVEIAWNDLISEDSERKQNALIMLRQLTKELPKDTQSILISMLSAVSQDNRQEAIIRQEASSIVLDTLDVSSLLQSYRIEIFYLDSDDTAKTSAENLNKTLQNSIDSSIELTPKSIDFFTVKYKPIGNEVRFHLPEETQAAQALASIINRNFPSLNIRTRTVTTPTPDYLSIMIWS